MIVGRTAELAVLDALVDGLLAPEPDADAVDDDREAPPRRLLIVGEPGAGKSALLDALARRARRRPVRLLRASAAQGSADVPRALVEDLLRAPRPFDAAGAAPTGATDLLAVLADLARAGPLLLLLDDLHWADEASSAALGVALVRCADLPVGVVATTRPAGLADPRLARWPRLEVGPLDTDSGVALLRAVARTPIAVSPARRLVQALGGNALAIHEAPRLLTPEQLTGEAALPDPLPVGPGLLTAWGDLVRRLPAASARALLARCVAGANGPLLDAVLADAGLTTSDLAPAVAAGLLRRGATNEPDAVDLAHPLVRDVVLQVAEPAQIAAAHARAATAAAVLGRPPAVVVAHLARAAEMPRQERARALAVQAERAQALEEAGVAARAWEAAARATDDHAVRAERAMRAVRLRLHDTLALADAGPLLDLVATLRLSPADRVWVEWLRIEVIGESDVRAALVAAETALEHALRDLPEIVPMLLWEITVTSFFVGEPEVALRHLGSWPAGWAGDEMIPAWGPQVLLGTALVQAGRVGEGEPLRAEAQELAAAADLVDAPLALLLSAVSLDAAMLNEDRAAEQRLDAALRRLEGDPGESLAFVWSSQAWLMLGRGWWARAAALAEQACDLERAVRGRTGLATALPVLVILAGARGDRAALAATTEELSEVCAAIGDPRHAVHAPATLGRCALVEGDLERAIALLGQAAGARMLGRGLPDGVLPARVDLVEALVRAGRRDEAGEVVVGLTPLLRALRDPLAGALLARAQAVVAADAGEADAAFHRALAAHTRSHDPFEEARTRLALGEHLRRTRRRARAREHLAAAAATFGRLGAVPWAARASEELRAAGGAGSPASAVATSSGDRLTTQERRVAEAVAQGMSTAEVAAALFLSPRTVEFHLGGAYRKLGVARRTALARALQEHAGHR